MPSPVITQPDQRFTGEAYEYLREADELPDYPNLAEDDPVAKVRLFLPGSRFEYYVTAVTDYEGQLVLTGYCVSPLGPDFNEEGDTALDDILAVRSKVFGLPMEREIGYEPERVSAIRERFSVYA